MWLPMFPSGSYILTAAIAEGKQESLAVHHWIDDAILIVINASRVRHGLAGAFISSVELNIFDA
jgi:hypothetical protein